MPTGVIFIMLLMLAGIVYFPGLQGEFLFDDIEEVARNPHMQQLDPPWPAMFEGRVLPARPIPYLSFALNYAVSGEQTWSYHVVDLLIHVISAWLIFSLLQMMLPSILPVAFQSSSASVSMVIAILWMIHPLQTQPVLYIYQRIEQLWSFCALLTLYSLWRATKNPVRPVRAMLWMMISVLSCALGMLSKETMVITPILVLSFDRIFLALSWQEIYARRVAYYVYLMLTWLFVAMMMIFQGDLYVEMQKLHISRWDYLLTEAPVILHYLRLIVWPSPLIFDYTRNYVHDFSQVWFAFSIDLLLVVTMIAGLWKCPRVAFWLWWFLLILAPTSSIQPVYQPICEYRLLLPLLGPLVLIVVAFLWTMELIRKHIFISVSQTRIHGVMTITSMLLILLTGSLCWARSCDYQSLYQLWEDTAEKVPDNHFPQNHLAITSLKRKDFAVAQKRFELALARNTDDPKIYNNLGVVHLSLQHYEQALQFFQQSLDHGYSEVEIWLGMGEAARKLERYAEAETYYRKYLELWQNDPQGYFGLANTLAHLIRDPGEIDELLQQGIACNADNPHVYYFAAEISAMISQSARVKFYLFHALQIEPNFKPALIMLANFEHQP
jgi:tetratricopeptide (TPR) repeat protein